MINFRAYRRNRGRALSDRIRCLDGVRRYGEVNVYTYRETKLIQPLFDAFTKDTGIKVNVVSASSGLEQRMKAEGANSPADVLLTVDHRPHRRRREGRRDPADQIGGDRRDRAGAIPRS